MSSHLSLLLLRSDELTKLYDAMELGRAFFKVRAAVFGTSVLSCGGWGAVLTRGGRRHDAR